MNSVSWSGCTTSLIDDEWIIQSGDYRSVLPNPRAATQTLANVLYSTVHAGQPASGEELPWLPPNDIEFEEQLTGAFSEELLDEQCEVLLEGQKDVLVSLAGVRIVAEREAIHESNRGTSIGIPAVRPNLSPGFLLLNSGKRISSLDKSGLVRIYFRIDSPEEAALAWPIVSDFLWRQPFPWQLKCLSRKDSYPRNDAIVAYVGYDAIEESLAELLKAVAPLWGLPKASGKTEKSPWVLHVSDHVAIAFEPDDPRAEYAGLSFGMHRSKLTAEAIISSLRHGLDPDENIAQHFTHGNVDSTNPWRNMTSPQLKTHIDYGQ